MHPRPRVTHLLCLVASAMLALGATACGSDDDDAASGGGAQGKQAKAAEKAFLSAMVPHHESGIDMAKVARDHGEDPFIKGIAEDIRSTQEREIAEMKRIYTRRIGGALKADHGAHTGLGLTAAEAGMTHSPATNRQLAAADPFDRAFVDEMVPHHKGAIRMANVVLEKSDDASIARLARSIIATQKREIEEMNDFRTKEFGGPVPGGAGHGAPSAGAGKKHGTPSGGAPAGKEHGPGHHPG